MAGPNDSTTLLSDLMVGDGGLVQGHGRLFLEALLFTGVAISIARFVAGDSAGIVSIFLAATALNDQLRMILAQNSAGIYLEKRRSVDVNRRSAAQFFALFAGITVAYACAAALLGDAARADMFRFALEAARLEDANILNRRFGSFGEILGHNALVLFGFVVLSFVFWSYGALLSIAWNSSIWAATITVMIRRALEDQRGEVGSIVIAGLSTVPHLCLEGLAYVLAAFAAIFASRSVRKYALADPVFWQVMRAVAALLVTAFASLTLGALSEVYLVQSAR